jgi:ADP-ribose pyrophosphatase YjhB (NUDIX family)
MRRALLEIADQLRALATTGLHFTAVEHDRERYQRLLALAARVGALAAEEDPGRIEAVFREADAGYVTPKVDVRLAVFRQGRVLLVRERADGRWALPGGYADVGDSPAEAAARETREEAGLSVRVERLAGVFDRRLHPEAGPHPFHIYKLLFVGRELDPAAEPRGGSEATAAAFFPLDDLPELSLGRTLPLHIEVAARVHLDPAARPHFE